MVTREAQSGAFADVTLDCAGTLTGWTAIEPADTIEYTRVDLVTGNFQRSAAATTAATPRPSTQPFGLTVWGWGSAASTGLLHAVRQLRVPGGRERQADQHGRDRVASCGAMIRFTVPA